MPCHCMNPDAVTSKRLKLTPVMPLSGGGLNV